jgi:hypothetical protein
MLLRVKVNPLVVSLSEDSPGHNSPLANARLLRSSLCTYSTVSFDIKLTCGDYGHTA